MQEYQAGIGNGSLMLNESRIIAKILLSNVERQELERLIREENVLQKRSLLTARKQAGLIKNRLQNVTPEIWEIIAESDIEKATQALLIAAVKHSSLLGDFLRRARFRRSDYGCESFLQYEHASGRLGWALGRCRF